ncbi:MAG: AAA family ATPase [Gaiellaceae bacterium]
MRRPNGRRSIGRSPEDGHCPLLRSRRLDIARRPLGPRRPIKAPFVGRQPELETLQRTLERAVDKRSPQLATILGPPGIGKSRLARELIQRSAARVLVGRCLSYGEGITY